VAAYIEHDARRPLLRLRIARSLLVATSMLLSTPAVAAGDRFPTWPPEAFAKRPAAADSSRSTGRNFVLVSAGATRWESVHTLMPIPSSFSIPFDGRFDADGGSFGISIQRGVRRSGLWAFYVGGDLVGFSHDSPSRDAGPPDPELGQMQAQMRATAGHLTLSARVVWPSNHLFTLHATTGLGVYVLMIQDHLAGNTSPNDTGNDSMSPGGYVGFGLDAALTRWVGVHVEGRMHAFRLGDIGLSYPGQSANAPCLELLFGLSNWSIPW
jgi:hypothetical protein